MFKSSVKTSTPAKQIMQNLCLTVFWLWVLALPISGMAQSAASLPADSMGQQVRQWLSQKHEVPAKEVVIAPLDERLKVQACEKPLNVDHPFASKETVRVRCTEPVWQLYLQVSLPNSTKPTPPAVNPNAKTGNLAPPTQTAMPGVAA